MYILKNFETKSCRTWSICIINVIEHAIEHTTEQFMNKKNNEINSILMNAYNGGNDNKNNDWESHVIETWIQAE